MSTGRIGKQDKSLPDMVTNSSRTASNFGKLRELKITFFPCVAYSIASSIFHLDSHCDLPFPIPELAPITHTTESSFFGCRNSRKSSRSAGKIPTTTATPTSKYIWKTNRASPIKLIFLPQRNGRVSLILFLPFIRIGLPSQHIHINVRFASFHLLLVLSPRVHALLHPVHPLPMVLNILQRLLSLLFELF